MTRYPHKPSRAGNWPVLAVLVGVQAAYSVRASASEVCRYAGTTDYAGHVAVTTDVSETNSLKQVRVALAFEAVPMLWLHVHYLMEEVSTWRSGELESVAVNNRYLIGGRIVRQQWDEFERSTEGFQARRVQGKTLAKFGRQHPLFVQHWDVATFGEPWIADYASAAPDRRPDLDLTGSPLPSGLRSPLALAFYWIRQLPINAQHVPVFLPGFKTERLLDLPISASPSPDGAVWHASLQYPALQETPDVVATAQRSRDGHLLLLAVEMHGPRGSAHGDIHLTTCEEATGTKANPSR